ncbi:MAG: hypothetical protein WAU24_11420 [Chitinophagaceae bacterium]
MRRILVIILFLTIGQNCFATEWLTYFIYIQTEYIQGPWTRTTIFDKSGSYIYLHPKEFEELFGSEGIDLANAIFNHLQKETESPKLYKFTYSLSLASDTVVIRTKETIVKLDAIKNELIASFTLNSFSAVKIIQPNKTTLYQIKDISIPYMDLVFPAESNMKTDNQAFVQTDSIKNDTLNSTTTTETLSNTEPEDKISIWLFISIIINLVLTVLIVRKKK